MATRHNSSGIYTITSPSGGQYVGSTTCFRTRWGHHRRQLRRGDHHSPMLQRAWDKYGEENIVFEKIIYCEVKDLTMYEQIAMDSLQPKYNVLKFARSCRGVIKTPEQRAHMSRVMTGKKKSPETIEKIRLANIGKKHSEETKNKLSNILKGKKKPEGHGANVSAAQIGKIIRPESIEKMKMALTGRILSPEHAAIARVAALGKKHSEESIERHRAAGKKWAEDNPEAILRIAEKNRGQKRNDETRLKISIARKAYFARKKLEEQNGGC